MSENKENKMVPKFRFTEFKDVWKTELLSNILDYERPDNYIVKDTNYISEGTPVLTANKSFILGYTQETFGICNDIPAIIFDDFTVDKKFVDFPFKVKSSAIKILRPKGKNDLKFIFELMLLIRFEAKEHKRYYISAYQNITVPIPKPNEQQKIAACLSSLDKLITAESQKLEVLKEHKKGLLQNLFPQEGETVPKFRFKEFEDTGEWKPNIVKNVFSIFQGFAFSSSDSAVNGVRWLKIADVGIQQMNHESPSFLPLELKEKYRNFLVKEGDYVIALTRPILNKKLKISKVDNILNESLLNQRVGKLVSNECVDFVYFLLQTSKLISTIEQNIAGSEPPNLSAQQIENIEVYIPLTIVEQEKIADTLSSVDDLINAQIQKLEALQYHKKGLLQSLFPNINKVTE